MDEGRRDSSAHQSFSAAVEAAAERIYNQRFASQKEEIAKFFEDSDPESVKRWRALDDKN